MDASSASVHRPAADSELPRYSGSSNSGTSRPPATPNAQSRSRTEHRYVLTNRNSRPWFTLKVPSRSPTPAHLPSLFEDEAITGSVELSFEREETIKSITIAIQGQMTTSTTDVYNFFNLSQELWSPSIGHPAVSVSSLSAGAKLRGTHTWTFSLTMPTHVTLNLGGGLPRVFRLPPSFSERMARVHIQYRLFATVHRGRFRVDSNLGTVFAYTPITQPDPPSMVRQIAYLERGPLVGPDGDPDGWKALNAVEMRGSIFNARSIEVTCTLWLAKPLCYTRGSSIPCLMTMECDDSQALDVLSSPKSIVVHLRRHISMGIANISDMNNRKVRGVPYQSTVQDVKAAFWWSSEDRSTSTPKRMRTLHGEILLGAALKPTCQLGEFRITYSVALYPLKAVAFAPEDNADKPLQLEAVEIATAYPTGPRPIIYSPPDYDDADARPTQAAEFNLFRRVSG